jgi:RNase adaptor protein for sRNA GlmZ degradation
METIEKREGRCWATTRIESEVAVAFGCKSGVYRSVVFAEELATRLREQGHEVELIHLHLKESR